MGRTLLSQVVPVRLIGYETSFICSIAPGCSLWSRLAHSWHKNSGGGFSGDNDIPIEWS
jgi:hypothetical protein